MKLFAGDGVPATGGQNFCKERATKKLNASHKARNRMLNLQERAEVNRARAFSVEKNPNWTSPEGSKVPHEPQAHKDIRRKMEEKGRRVRQ
jgi:hypothetical protein